MTPVALGTGLVSVVMVVSGVSVSEQKDFPKAFQQSEIIYNSLASVVRTGIGRVHVVVIFI